MAKPTRRDFLPAGSSLVVAARDVPLLAESTLAPLIALQERGITASLTPTRAESSRTIRNA